MSVDWNEAVVRHEALLIMQALSAGFVSWRCVPSYRSTPSVDALWVLGPDKLHVHTYAQTSYVTQRPRASYDWGRTYFSVSGNPPKQS